MGGRGRVGGYASGAVTLWLDMAHCPMKRRTKVPIRTLAIRDATAMLNDHGEDGVKAVTALTKGLHSMSGVEFVATLWDRYDAR